MKHDIFGIFGIVCLAITVLFVFTNGVTIEAIVFFIIGMLTSFGQLFVYIKDGGEK